MKHLRLHRISLIGVALLAFATTVLGQTAQVTGRISDASGAVVPGAEISVTNQANGFKRDTVTNDEGYYTIPLLQPGTYEVSVRKDGFRPIIQSGVTLQVEQVARLDFKLDPGAVTEAVNVAADAPLLEKENSTLGTVVDRQRRAIWLKSTPLTRMLAEVVLRPPDVRHLDAAFQGMAASPRRESSLKVSLGDLYATRCATCGRTLVVDDIIWGIGEDDDVDSTVAAPIARVYRCTVCRDQRGGSEQRQGPLDPDDLARASADVGVEEARASLRGRFAPVDGAESLVDELLALHAPRQLVGLSAILDRIEGDLRAAPVLAALRLAFLHSILPASRLATTPGRIAALRIGGGHVKLPTATQWRERNPWLAFEDGVRIVRGFVQRLEGGALGPLQARLGEDLRSLGEGTATAVLALSSPSGLRLLRDDADDYTRSAPNPKIRLILGQPPVRPGLERLGAAYHATSWVLGREASAVLPIDALAGPSLRAPWSWQAATIGRALEAAAPAMSRDGRAVMLVDGGPEALAAAVLGGAGAGYRLVSARLAGGDDDAGGVVEFLPPGAARPPGPRTRSNVSLDPIPGGPGDPDMVPGPGLFSAAERFDQRPFSAFEAAKTVTEVAVETLRARGEPARYERLLGEVLVGLDRAGQLRRLAAATDRSESPRAESTDAAEPMDGPARGTDGDPGTTGDPGSGGPGSGAGDGGPRSPRGGGSERAVGAPPNAPATSVRAQASGDASQDPVERLLALVRDEMARPTNTRLTEIEPGRWWLADQKDQDAASIPLADRVEWSVFSLLSTAGPLSESAFYERIATLFTGHDLPDEGLVRACLDSYRSLASTPDNLITTDDLLRRSQEHTDLLATLVDAGHRLGMRVWLPRREHSRRTGGTLLGDRLDRREHQAYLGSISRSSEELAEVDCIWYIRSKVALLFEVEWTAMLGEPLLGRHARIPHDDNLIRFLVIAPERTELIRYKFGRSPLLREALETTHFHIIKSDHLRRFLAHETPDLDDLEPLIGLDPVIERTGEQMPLFGG